MRSKVSKMNFQFSISKQYNTQFSSCKNSPSIHWHLTVQQWRQMRNFWTAVIHFTLMVYGRKDLTRNMLLYLKVRTTSILTANITPFTDTAPQLRHKIRPSDEAFLNCAMYEKIHILENSLVAYGLLYFGCITIWQACTYSLEAAHFCKPLPSTPQRYMASHPIIQLEVIIMLMWEPHISLSGSILHIKEQIKCYQILQIF